ncbi:hypothetical protein [Flavobacterium mekongense]|uniref:hypothetical protein n=1 Tax=Flavobacterium mekongense TaxID=3379707 RepID=UPI00399B038A
MKQPEKNTQVNLDINQGRNRILLRNILQSYALKMKQPEKNTQVNLDINQGRNRILLRNILQS